MNGSASLPIALAFVLGILPFALWTCWMLREDHAIRTAELVATPHGQARRHPAPERQQQFVDVRAGSFCRVSGAIGFTRSGEAVVCTPSTLGIRARWRREQMAA
jgi:hypothetical protein